ncbi:MAG: carboxypeptidase-like regulatory domain-containing protein [Saprospiraceae bacterium]
MYGTHLETLISVMQELMYRTTIMLVQAQNPTIAGNIKNAQNVSVPNVKVTLSGMGVNAMMTDPNGHYQFNNLVTGEDYTALPHRDGDDRNGVST